MVWEDQEGCPLLSIIAMGFWSSFQVQVERHATPEEKIKASEQLLTPCIFINMVTSVPSGLLTQCS